MLKAVQLGGRAFLAGTSVDGAFALRACIVNPGLTAARVPGLLRDIRDRAAELLSAGLAISAGWKCRQIRASQCRPSRRLIAWTARPKSVPNGLSWTT